MERDALFLAVQVLLWQLVRQGAVGSASLAEELERHAKFSDDPATLLTLSKIARAAGLPEIAEPRLQVALYEHH